MNWTQITIHRTLYKIPDDEDDTAVKELLQSEGIDLTVVDNPQNIVKVLKRTSTVTSANVPKPSTSGVTMQNPTVITLTPQNVIPVSGVTGQNVAITHQNVVPVSGVTGHNVAITHQNIIPGSSVTGQNVVNIANISDVAHVTPILPPGVISAPFPVQQQQLQQQQLQQQPMVVISDIPEGYKKTKYDDTLEKTDLKTLPGQKAPKRFYCMRCMDRGVETGYTKHNDLTKHLTSCGGIKEKKYKCTYEGCNAAYVCPDNLKQHIALQHTHVFLYKCKKCGKEFYTSPDVTSHRKQYYPIAPDKDHVTEETDPKTDENGTKNQKGADAKKVEEGE